MVELLPPVSTDAPNCKYSPDTLATILSALRHGATMTSATFAAGITRETMRTWTIGNPAISALVAQARADFRQQVEERFGTDALESDDWRARHAWLQSHPDTRAEWGQTLNLAQIPADRLRELLTGDDGSEEAAWPTIQAQQAALPPATDSPEAVDITVQQNSVPRDTLTCQDGQGEGNQGEG